MQFLEPLVHILLALCQFFQPIERLHLLTLLLILWLRRLTFRLVTILRLAQIQLVQLPLRSLTAAYHQDVAAKNRLERRALPRARAVVLIHERMLRFGTGAQVVVDMPGTQGGISYATLEIAWPASLTDEERRHYEALKTLAETSTGKA